MCEKEKNCSVKSHLLHSSTTTLKTTLRTTFVISCHQLQALMGRPGNLCLVRMLFLVLDTFSHWIKYYLGYTHPVWVRKDCENFPVPCETVALLGDFSFWCPDGSNYFCQLEPKALPFLSLAVYQGSSC